MAGGTGPVARTGTLVTPGETLRLVTPLPSVTTLLDVTWLCLLICDLGHSHQRGQGTDDILDNTLGFQGRCTKVDTDEPTEQAETLFYLSQSPIITVISWDFFCFLARMSLKYKLWLTNERPSAALHTEPGPTLVTDPWSGAFDCSVILFSDWSECPDCWRGCLGHKQPLPSEWP